MMWDKPALFSELSFAWLLQKYGEREKRSIIASSSNEVNKSIYKYEVSPLSTPEMSKSINKWLKHNDI